MAEIITAAGMTPAIAKTLKEGFIALRDFGKDSVNDMTRAFDSMNGFLTLFNPIAAPLQLITTTLGSASLPGTIALMQSLMDFVMAPQTQAVLTGFGQILGTIFTWMSKIVDLAADPNKIVTWADTLAVTLKGALEEITRAVMDWAKGLPAAVVAELGAVLDAVVDWITSLPSVIIAEVDGISTAIQTWIQNLIANIITWLKNPTI